MIILDSKRPVVEGAVPTDGQTAKAAEPAAAPVARPEPSQEVHAPEENKTDQDAPVNPDDIPF